MMQKPLLIAHRGASNEAPENTIAAIQRALDLKVDFVEFDVRFSNDGIPVVLHDPSPARMIGKKNVPPVSRLTLAEIQNIDVGHHFHKSYTGEKIPALSEVLNLNWNATGLMIEIKATKLKPQNAANAVFEVLSKATQPLPPIVIGSFSLEIMQEVQNILIRSDFKMGMLGIVEKADLVLPFINQGFEHLALWHKILDSKAMYHLNNHKISVWSFTVDDPKIAQSLIALGVKGIISNVPKLMLESQIFS